jgi:hypothetical protein
MYQPYDVSTANEPMSDRRLAEMLGRARSRNPGANVTGMLLHVGRNYCQALEGPRADMRGIFEDIAAGSRHRDVHVVLETDGGTRDFPGWCTGFRRSDPAALAEEGAFDLTGIAPSRFERILGDGGAIKSLLKSFYRANRRNGVAADGHLR